MKKTLISLFLFFILTARGQSDWKQSLQYDIHVHFNPAEKSMDALMNLSYTNHSPDTILFIWFHVWPNAYRNDRTLYSDQLLENGDTRFYFSSKEQKGYLNRLEFRVNGALVTIQDHPQYIDVVKILLPNPLLPGDQVSISASFHLRLPFNFTGNGYSAHHVEMRNWYPEPAVYDRQGWHPMPFLVQGGAYHEAADYTVEIEAPPAYRIAAGAVPDTIRQSASFNLYRYNLSDANAFAWIADTRYQIKTDSLILNSGKPVRLQYFFTDSRLNDPVKLLSAAKKEVLQLSEWLMPFPNPTLSLVQASTMEDQSFTGLACIGPHPGTGWQNNLRDAITGLWFQTMLMTDQRNDPWFSRGFMNYYNQRLFNEFPHTSKESSYYKNRFLWLRVAEQENSTQPINTASPEFSVSNDSLIPETKAGIWVSQLRDSVGSHSFDQNMKAWFMNWSFGHPYPEDFKRMMGAQAGNRFQPLFNKLSETQSLFTPETKKLKPAFVFSSRNSERYNYIGIAPVAGFNRYDGFMLGALIHNINLPENKFEFLFTPMYAFGSKTLEGLGRLSYTWRPQNHFSLIRIGLNGGRFDTNKATDSLGNILFENFSKLVPYIRFDFKPLNSRSTVSKWMDFRSYLITEKSFGDYGVSSVDSLIHPNSLSSQFRYVNQLSFNLKDGRALYPYDLRIELQQSELFYRINLQANYFFNYAGGGGMQVRFFAAQFGVWSSKNDLSVTRYEPKLLGVNGEEDYLYEDYFIARSASYAIEKTSVPNGGWPAQQIMNRDGGLKLRIDDYDYVQGRSASWVSSLNFNTTLPNGLFPFPLPLRLFFDVGTYSEAWQNNPPTSHFLYVGGIQLSLFRNLLNIYAPLFYSSDFRDALAGVNYGRKITFSIDIQNIQYKKLIRKLAEHD